MVYCTSITYAPQQKLIVCIAGFGSAGVDDDGDYEEEDDGDEDGDEGEEDYDAQDMELAMEESRRAAYYGDNQAAGSSASASAYAPSKPCLPLCLRIRTDFSQLGTMI